MNRLKAGILAIALCISSVRAATIFYSGNLRGDATITGCGASCTLAAGDSDATWAQWAAVAEPFTVAVPTTMNAITFGFAGGTSATGPVVAAGGLEPYLSLFDSGGNFLGSTFNGITCPPGAGSVGGNCFDVELDGGLLQAGSYTIVLSAYENMSLAENLGAGMLSDGFSGLGNLNGTENLNYAFDLNLSPTVASTPEPASGLMLLVGVTLIALRLPRRGKK